MVLRVHLSVVLRIHLSVVLVVFNSKQKRRNNKSSTHKLSDLKWHEREKKRNEERTFKAKGILYLRKDTLHTNEYDKLTQTLSSCLDLFLKFSFRLSVYQRQQCSALFSSALFSSVLFSSVLFCSMKKRRRKNYSNGIQRLCYVKNTECILYASNNLFAVVKQKICNVNGNNKSIKWLTSLMF